MQLEQMFPGEDGAQFIAHLVDGALPRLRLELLTYCCSSMESTQDKARGRRTHRPHQARMHLPRSV